MELATRFAAAKTDLAALEIARRRFWREAEGARDWSPMDAQIDEQAFVVSELAKQIEDAAWTHDVTAARRAEWNSWVRANATKQGVPSAAAVAQQQRQGWTVTDLKAAVARHGL